MGGFQQRETGVRIEARFTRQAGINHHAHTRQGHRRFRQVGREDDAAATTGVRLQRCALLLHRHVAIERNGVEAGKRFAFERARDVIDLALAGQEHQGITIVRCHGVFEAAPDLQAQGFVALRR